MSDIKIANLIRSRRRSIALIVTPEATLTVRAPLHTPLSFIESLIQKKAAWIRQRIQEAQHRPPAVPWKFVEGEEFLFLGQAYRLKFSDGDRIELNGGLLFPREFLARAREELTFWYRQKALKLILERVDHNARIMGLKPTAVRLSGATRRWASCGGGGVLHFNWRLVMTPLPVLDYVVVHELAHLAVRSHSARFWSKVRMFCPDHKIFRTWLRNNQERIIPDFTMQNPGLPRPLPRKAWRGFGPGNAFGVSRDKAGKSSSDLPHDPWGGKFCYRKNWGHCKVIGVHLTKGQR